MSDRIVDPSPLTSLGVRVTIANDLTLLDFD